MGRFYWAGILLPLLSACATLEAQPPKDAQGVSIPISPAGFKIQSANVRWDENPAFATRLEQTVPLAASAVGVAAQQAAAPPRVYRKPGTELRVHEQTAITSAALARPAQGYDPRLVAERYIGAILKVFREHAPGKVASMFTDPGGGGAATHDIVLTPVSGFQSVDGWGTHVVIRAVVHDRASGRVWRTDLQVDSGVQWVGVANAAEPTSEFVDRYVAGLRSALRKAEAL